MLPEVTWIPRGVSILSHYDISKWTLLLFQFSFLVLRPMKQKKKKKKKTKHICDYNKLRNLYTYPDQSGSGGRLCAKQVPQLVVMQAVLSLATDKRANANTPTPPASDKRQTSMETSPEDLCPWLIPYCFRGRNRSHYIIERGYTHRTATFQDKVYMTHLSTLG